jgi:hypothetical protein
MADDDMWSGQRTTAGAIKQAEYGAARDARMINEIFMSSTKKVFQ